MARPPTAEEKAKIAAGPRYDPGKPTKRWPAEPKAKAPIIAEAPPVKAPLPPPPTPVLEPLIPQPEVQPKDTKVVSTDAKGNPTILETPDGKKHYTSFHTTMWGELGFKNEDEYLESQKTGVPSQYVGITEGVETPVRVSRAALGAASTLKGEKQFDAFRELGVIPFGSKFLPGPGGYQGADWSYIHPDTIKKYKGQLLARLARRSVKKPRVVIPPLEVRPTPPYREERPALRKEPPVRIEVRHPAYLKGRKAFRELQATAGKPTLENIQETIDEWKKAQEWWVMFEDLHPATIKAGFQREFEGTAGKEYVGKLETYNNQVVAYNIHIENFDKIATDLEKEGKALGIDKVEKYNDEMVKLNALTLSWERQAAGINLENEAAVRLHNQKLLAIQKDYEKLAGRVGAINTTLLAINAFNAKIDKFNANLAKLVDPGEPPAEYLKTAGNIAAKIYKQITTEYKKAASIEGRLKDKVDNVALLTAEYFVPLAEIPSPYFGIKWADRSLANKLFNLALDALILAPIARTATMFIRQALGTTARGAIKLALKAEAKLVKDAVKAMRQTYGKDAAKSLQKVAELQAVYLKRLAKLESIKAAGKPVTRQLKATLRIENKLRAASRHFADEVRNAQSILTTGKWRYLKDARGKYVHDAQGRLIKLALPKEQRGKGVVGAGFDSPETAKAFFKMPEEIVRQTKGTLQAIIKAKPKKVKQLKADVAKAEAALKATQDKYPLDPSRWTALIGELLEKQAILSQRTVGSLAKIQQELLKVQQQLSRVRAKMKDPGLTARESRTLKLIRAKKAAGIEPTAKQLEALKVILEKMKYPGARLTVKQRRILKQEEFRLERRLLDLTQKLHTGIRTMEVEWGRGGVVMGGGGGRTATATAVRPRTAPTSVSATVTAPTVATMTTAQVAAMSAITAAVVKAVGKPIPEVAAVVSGLTDVEIIKAVEAATIKAVEAAHKLALQPTTKTGLSAKQKLAVEVAQITKLIMQTAVKTAPSAKIAQALETAVKPVSKAAIKVGLLTASPLKPLEAPKPLLPILPPEKTEEAKREAIREADGAIAWRQGELGKGKDVWRVGLYPYDKNDLWFTVVGRKPEGATLVTGPGSAFQSVTLLRGRAPAKTITGDIGFFDFEITPTGPKTIGLRFTPDPKQLTTGDISGSRLPRRKLPGKPPRMPKLRR